MADNRPDALDSAYFAGRNASEADAVAWKQRFEADPQDVLARASWIGWQSGRDLNGFLGSVDFRDQIVWLIANLPGSSLTGIIVPFASGRRSPSFENELRTLWVAAIEREPENIPVLENAARFFGLRDSDTTHELLQAARALAPLDPGKEQALASHWLLRSRRYSSRFMEGPFRFEDEFNAEMAIRALAHAERAVELSGREKFNEWHELTRIEAAAAAGAWARAEEVSSAALARVNSGRAGRITGNIAFHANRVLGHAALRRGDIPTARGHLLDSCSGGTSPQLASFGPDWSLARELLERGEREVVLEFLRKCRAIWSRHDDSLDLWELQIRRGEPCEFARAGLAVPRLVRPLTGKSPTTTDEEEPDERDPTEHAYVAGLHASESDAREWLERTRNQPEDLWSRAAWLGWATRHQDGNGVLDEVLTQLEWLVQHKPEHPFTGGAGFGFTQARNAGMRARIDELWLDQTQRPDVRPEVLGNAASHFWSTGDPLPFSLLERASKLDPKNPRWPAQAAFVHLAGAHRTTKGATFESQFDKTTCEQALVEAERAFALSGETEPEYMQLRTHMLAAAGAGQWPRAEEVARDTLRRLPALRILRARKETCLQVAHMILGLAQLRHDKRHEAKRELREAVACVTPRADFSAPPNALLALELLALGEQETMLEFLESSRPLCSREQAQIDLWQAHVRAGRTPDFDFRWLHL